MNTPNMLEESGLTTTSLVHWKISRLRIQLRNTCRIFRIREVIPDCSMVDSFSTGYTFPLRAVKDQLTRTLGLHGDATEVSFPHRGSMGKIQFSQKNNCDQESARSTGD